MTKLHSRPLSPKDLRFVCGLIGAVVRNIAGDHAYSITVEAFVQAPSEKFLARAPHNVGESAVADLPDGTRIYEATPVPYSRAPVDPEKGILVRQIVYPPDGAPRKREYRKRADERWIDIERRTERVTKVIDWAIAEQESIQREAESVSVEEEGALVAEALQD